MRMPLHDRPPPPPHNSPVNPLPPVVVALFGLIVAIEAAFSLGARGIVGGPQAVGWRQGAVQDFGVNGAILDWMLKTGSLPPGEVLRLVSYLFVHGSFTHALIAGIMLLALGKMVGEVMSALAVVVIFLGSGALGALVFGLVLDSPQWLIGAFPGVYGLIGAFTYLLWQRLGQVGAQQARAFSLIAFLMGIQLLFGLLFGGSVEWVADLAGFAAGFALTVLLVPGGWQRLAARIRRG